MERVLEERVYEVYEEEVDSLKREAFDELDVEEVSVQGHVVEDILLDADKAEGVVEEVVEGMMVVVDKVDNEMVEVEVEVVVVVE